MTDLHALSLARLDEIQYINSRVLASLDLSHQQRINTLVTSLRDVLALHRRGTQLGGRAGRCIEDMHSWPCPTVRAVAAALGVTE